MKNASVFDFICFNTITFGRIYPIRTKWVQLGDEVHANAPPECHGEPECILAP